MIKPTVGRVVLFTARGEEAQPPIPAIVTAVWGDRCVNLAVFGRNGVPLSHPPTSVTLVQPDDPRPNSGPFCEWKQYQVGKAAKTEEAEKKLAAATA